MKVVVKGIGDLREYFGREPRELELPEGARVSDLLQRIGQVWGAGLPRYLWDFEKSQFRGPVLLVVNKKAVLDLDASLREGTEISIMRAIAGG